MRKKRRKQQLEESNQLGPDPVSSKTDSDERTGLQNGPDHGIWIKPDQPATSSSSSECSSSGTRSKLNLNTTKYKSIRSNLNNNGDAIKKTKTKNCAKSPSELGMATRNRICRASSGSNSRQVILGRRIISPGVFEYLVQNH